MRSRSVQPGTRSFGDPAGAGSSRSQTAEGIVIDTASKCPARRRGPQARPGSGLQASAAPHNLCVTCGATISPATRIVRHDSDVLQFPVGGVVLVGCQEHGVAPFRQCTLHRPGKMRGHGIATSGTTNPNRRVVPRRSVRARGSGRVQFNSSATARTRAFSASADRGGLPLNVADTSGWQTTPATARRSHP